MPDQVATLEEPAVSPSGDYRLVVVSGYDGTVRFQAFQVLSQDGESLYLSPDRFGLQHTTYFLWDQDDRVWVYSGDLGTFFWELEDTGEWKKHVYAQSDVPAPDFLKEVRPRWHQK